ATNALLRAIVQPPFAPLPPAVARKHIGVAEYANWLMKAAFEARRFQEIWFASTAWSFDSSITELTRTPHADLAYVCGFFSRTSGTAAFVAMIDATYPDPIDRTSTPALALFDLQSRIDYPDGGMPANIDLAALRRSTAQGWEDTKRIRDYMRLKACEY